MKVDRKGLTLKAFDSFTGLADKMNADGSSSRKDRSHFINNKKLILEALKYAPIKGNVLILGAGSLFDVPLKEISENKKNREICLVDVDLEVMKKNLERLKLTGNPKIALYQKDASGLPEEFYGLVHKKIQRAKNPLEAISGLNKLFDVYPHKKDKSDFAEMGLVTSSMLLTQFKTYLGNFLGYEFEEKFGQEANETYRLRLLGENFNRLYGRILSAHIDDLYRMVAKKGFIYLASEIIEFDPNRLSQLSIKGNNLTLTPALLLSEFKNDLAFMEVTLNNPDPPDLQTWLPQLAGMQGDHLSIAMPSLGIYVRPAWYPKNKVVCPEILDPQRFTTIKSDAWIWQCYPDSWFLTQGIILKAIKD